MTHLTIQGRSLTAMEWGNRLLLLILTISFASAVGYSFLTDTLDPIGILFRILLGGTSASMSIYTLIMIFEEYKYTLYTLVIRDEKLKIHYKEQILYSLEKDAIKMAYFFNLSEKRYKMSKPFLDLFTKEKGRILHLWIEYKDYEALKTYFIEQDIPVKDEVIFLQD